jgi:hypothetical protein
MLPFGMSESRFSRPMRFVHSGLPARARKAGCLPPCAGYPGFLDGKEGLVFHFLQGFWYRFLVDAKLFENSEQKSGVSSVDGC